MSAAAGQARLSAESLKLVAALPSCPLPAVPLQFDRTLPPHACCLAWHPTRHPSPTRPPNLPTCQHCRVHLSAAAADELYRIRFEKLAGELQMAAQTAARIVCACNPGCE